MRRSPLLALSVGIAFASLSCGSTIDVGNDAPPGPNPGNGTVVGTADGHPLAAQDAIGDVNNTGVVHSLWVTISDQVNMCAALQRGAESFANATLLRLDLMSDPPDGAPLTLGAGTYTLGRQTATKPAVTAHFAKTDAACTNVVSSGNQSASSGTLTISDVGASTIAGTFDLAFAKGSLQGSFIAARCADGATARGNSCEP